MKLLIRNLARTTTEKELQSLFAAYGTVQSCTLVMDKETGSSKGFGERNSNSWRFNRKKGLAFFWSIGNTC